MGRKDYYATLGLAHGATLDAVRTAFRRLALEYHPDRAGREGASRFREAVEAYETLSDPDRRTRYDAETTSIHTSRARTAEPLFSSAPDAEPLIPDAINIPESFEHVGPSIDALFDRIVRNFIRRPAAKAERPEPLNVELVVSPLEAMGGTVVTVGVPVFAHCANCRGSGRDWASLCLRCGGRGVLRHRSGTEKPALITRPVNLQCASAIEAT